jgi:hypothetical protein
MWQLTLDCFVRGQMLKVFAIVTFGMNQRNQHLAPVSNLNAPAVVRTRDPLLRRQVLYPAELRVHIL